MDEQKIPNCSVCNKPMTLIKEDKVEIWVCHKHSAISTLDLSWYFDKLKKAKSLKEVKDG